VFWLTSLINFACWNNRFSYKLLASYTSFIFVIDAIFSPFFFPSSPCLFPESEKITFLPSTVAPLHLRSLEMFVYPENWWGGLFLTQQIAWTIYGQYEKYFPSVLNRKHKKTDTADPLYFRELAFHEPNSPFGKFSPFFFCLLCGSNQPWTKSNFDTSQLTMDHNTHKGLRVPI